MWARKSSCHCWTSSRSFLGSTRTLVQSKQHSSWHLTALGSCSKRTSCVCPHASSNTAAKAKRSHNMSWLVIQATHEWTSGYTPTCPHFRRAHRLQQEMKDKITMGCGAWCNTTQRDYVAWYMYLWQHWAANATEPYTEQSQAASQALLLSFLPKQTKK